MKLIFIYGPPATGKLTVARELSKLTGYKIFHNHLTADLVSSFFPFGTKAYSDLVARIRLDLIETAAKNKVRGVIFTFVYGIETYGGRMDDRFIKKSSIMLRSIVGKSCSLSLLARKKNCAIVSGILREKPLRS